MRSERFQRLREVLARRQPDLTVLMDRVNKSHNFSAILRNCDAAGVLEAHVVPPEKGLPLHHGTSAGTKKWVRVRLHEEVASAISSLQASGFRVIAAHPSDDAIDYREIDYRQPTAILVGAELDGVSSEGLEFADAHVSVPMHGMVRSLNVSVATSLLLFEAMRQREEAGMYAETRLSPDDFERHLFEWAWPSIASRRRREGRAYPKLTADGDLVRE
jgi:tRNA (guanosine-2'-O-)-methyltransferase